MYLTTPGGVLAARYDPATGAMDGLRPVLPGAQTSFLARHPVLPLLYVPEPDRVSTYGMEADGGLRLLHEVPMAGGKPVHIALDRSARVAVVPSYHGATAAVFPVAEDGTLQAHTALFRYEGRSIDPDRQTRAYPHGVAFHPTTDLAVVADLGSDKLWLYDVDPAGGTLAPRRPPGLSVAPGAGPRHALFHPGGHALYLLNELDNTVTHFAVHPDRSLEPRQRVSTLPERFTGFSTAAELVLHPGGTILYASNRGHDSVAVLRVAGGEGDLSLAGTTPVAGQGPRFIGLDPAGRHLLSANQSSGEVVSFAVDPATGALAPTGHRLPVEGPTCIVFP